VLRANDVSVVALALTPEAIALDVFAAKPPTKLALVLGTEGDGLSLRAVGDSDAVVAIPMRGGVDSLNVAAASAVALWALRNR
jgi:tRNA G18 (ribose-2'-O)-methylase SpoU